MVVVVIDVVHVVSVVIVVIQPYRCIPNPPSLNKHNIDKTREKLLVISQPEAKRRTVDFRLYYLMETQHWTRDCTRRRTIHSDGTTPGSVLVQANSRTGTALNLG